MIRVVYMAHALQIGGAEEMLLNLVRGLPRAEFEPRVCCIHEAGPIGEEIRKSGTTVDVLGLTPGMRHPFAVDAIRRYLRRVRPDVVHTLLLTASLYGRLAAILARVPVIVGSEVNVYERKRRRHVWIERALMSSTDCVVVSAESVRDFYLRQIHAAPAKVEVIYNAVDWNQTRATMPRADVRRALGLQVDDFVIGTIARLTEQKGHRFLFDAVARNGALKDVQLLLVGGGELEDELKRHAETLGIAARVHFVGPRRDLGDLLSAMDVFTLPSLWEGLPLSLVLAMGAGVPVVSTTVAGVPEVVETERTGLLVRPADATQLGDALARVATDAGLRDRLSQAASASVLPRFGADAYVDATARLYQRLLTGGRQRLAS
jgi:glycosyltransferase involved in cell wall biosynthesis